MGLGCLIGLPCFADEFGNPVYSAGVNFASCLASICPPMSYATSTMLVPGKRIDEARNLIVKAALDQQAEHVLFLDTDVLFPADAFMKLLLRQRNNPEHKITSGVYWSKSNPTFPLIFHEAGRGSYLDWKVGDYIEAEYAVGMGLCLIHTDVFRAIPEPWFSINYGLLIDRETGSKNASSITEDLMFCERAAKAGYRIWVDTSVQAGHYDNRSGMTFGLNPSMPQAEHREPKKSTTLFIGDILAGGEPAHILSENKTLKPTWIGTPEVVPTTDTYSRVCIKSDVSRESLPVACAEWFRTTSDGGLIEILHPDFPELLKRGVEVKSKGLYPPETIVENLRSVGFVEIASGREGDQYHITARKPVSLTPLISVIVVAHDLHDMTSQCIASLRLTQHEDFEFEIVLVDNGSETPYSSIGDTLIRSEQNLPYGQAVTLGVSKAKDSTYLCFANNDTLFPNPEWLGNLLARIRGNGQIAAVGPKQVSPTGTIYHTEIGFTPERIPYHLWLGYSHDHPSVQTEKPVLALNFGCVLIRRSVFADLLLDERYGGIGNYEDIDWCLRVREKGGVLLYTPSAEIIHFGAQTQAQDPEASKDSIATNCAKFVERWTDAPAELFAEEETSNP